MVCTYLILNNPIIAGCKVYLTFVRYTLRFSNKKCSVKVGDLRSKYWYITAFNGPGSNRHELPHQPLVPFWRYMPLSNKWYRSRKAWHRKTLFLKALQFHNQRNTSFSVQQNITTLNFEPRFQQACNSYL